MLTEFTVLGRTIPTYSIAAAVGIIAAVFYTKIRVRDKRFADLDRYLELEYVWALAGTAIGAKLLYLLVESRHLLRDIGEYGIMKAGYAYLVGGFVFYGGMLGCIAAIYLYCRRSKVSFDHSMQLFVPVIPLMHFFGRLGCFVTGCCFGRETDSFLHVIYTHSQFAPNGVPLVPVQLIEAVYELALFCILHRDSGRDIPGDVMLCKYFMLYGAGRFILEFFRGDAYRGHIGALSVSQAISLLCIAAGAAYILHIRKKKTADQ